MTPARLAEIRALCTRYGERMPFPQTMELVEALETEMARLKFLAQHAEVGIGDIRDRWGVYFSVPEMPHQETENVETAFLAAIDSAREREKGNPT